jgi:hypothetical protein
MNDFGKAVLFIKRKNARPKTLDEDRDDCRLLPAPPATLLGKKDSEISSKPMLKLSLGLLLGLSKAMGCKGCKCSTHHRR